MNKIEKGLHFLMYASIVIMVLVFIISIAVGHATNYNFLYGVQDFTNFTVDMVSNVKTTL